MNRLLKLQTDAEWLSAFPSLQSVVDTAWHAAVRSARDFTLPSGTTVVNEGGPCREFVLIVEGSLRVYKSAASGRELTLYRTCGGGICTLTLASLLRSANYSASAVSETVVRLVGIPTTYFHRAMADSPAFRTFVTSTLAGRLDNAMALIEQLAFQKLDLRLACLLGQLFGLRNTRRVTVTHEELAHELGSTRVVVSRLLKEFERIGCIRLHWGGIELLSPEALARLAVSGEQAISDQAKPAKEPGLCGIFPKTQ